MPCQFLGYDSNSIWVQIQRVHSDNGTEFTNGTFKTFFIERGVTLETSCVDTPQ